MTDLAQNLTELKDRYLELHTRKEELFWIAKMGLAADPESAQRQLGDTSRWPEIWDMNRDRVANENLIYPRLVLLMP